MSNRATGQTDRGRALPDPDPSGGGAAHEINQPLTALLGPADLMLMKLEEDDPARGTFETFQKAGVRIRDIVKQMHGLKDVVTRPYIQGVEIIDFEASSKPSKKNVSPFASIERSEQGLQLSLTAHPVTTRISDGSWWHRVCRPPRRVRRR